MVAWLRLAGTPGYGLPAQRRSVRVWRRPELVPVDLPVDVVVVLEQQKRAGQPQGPERALGKR